MSRTAVVLDDDAWERVLDHLGGADDETLAACRDDIARQVDDDGLGVDPDIAFGLLADPVRRAVLRRVRGHDEVPLAELEDWVAADLDGDDENLRLALHHTHLPKLRNAGVVRLSGGRVRYDGDPLLDCLAAVAEK